MMDLFIQDVDLNESLTSLLSTPKGLVKDKPIEIVTDIETTCRHLRRPPPHPPDLLNMVSNAVKFTRRPHHDRGQTADDEIHLT